MRRWLAGSAALDQRPDFEAQRERKVGFARLIRDYRKQLQALYKIADSTERQRQAKAGLLNALRRDFAELKANWGGYAGYDRFFAEDLNNAKLASLSLYSELVPAFEALLDQEDHQLPRFYQRVRALAALDKEARREMLARLAPASDDTRLARSGVATGVPETQ
jgi:predicted aminopeptidase